MDRQATTTQGAATALIERQSTAAIRLWDAERREAIPVEQVREGAHGQLVLRLTRKRPNHPAYDHAEDARYERLLAAFTGWLERDDEQPLEVVRLTAPKGALLLDVGKWAVEYAPVGTPAGDAGR